jgi:hypothetical protein
MMTRLPSRPAASLVEAAGTRQYNLPRLILSDDSSTSPLPLIRLLAQIAARQATIGSAA